MDINKEIILVDGSSYFYRAYHALPPLTTSTGIPTGAIHGVLNMLKKLINDRKPNYMVVVFDAKGKTFRDQIYKEYKANRPPMPEDLQLQITPLKEAIENLGMPLLSIEGVEADDVLGTLALEAKNSGFNVIISTGDKDMAQLVNENITLVNTMSDQVLDQDGVKDKFGIYPDRIIDYLSLIGDKVDNVPGVQGCGPKTAIKWLNQFGTLENVIKNAKEIKGKVGDNLKNSIEQLYLAKKLVTIKTDLSLSKKIEDLTISEPNIDKLIPLFQKLEMNKWLKEVTSSRKNDQPANTNYSTIYLKKDFDNLCADIKKASVFAFDTETTSLDFIEAKLVGVSVAIEPSNAFYIPINHDESPRKQLSQSYVLDKFKKIFDDDKKTIIGHNLKYDLNILRNYNIEVKNKLFDTMVASYVLNTTNTRHDMDTLALKWLEHKTISFSDVAGSGKEQKTFNEVDISKATEYAAEDADITLQLYNIFKKQLDDNKWAKNLCEQIDFPLLEMISRVERQGVLVNTDLLAKQSLHLLDQINKLTSKAYKIAGHEFNLSSPKQLQDILYNELQIPVIKKTPKGQPSTAESVLRELSYEYELPEIILEYRQLSKLKSTYTDSLPEQVSPLTKRVHTSYNQTVTSTGRLSSTEPNLQNIPIRTDEGKKIREAFIAPNNYLIMSADYSQIELRVMAHLSNDNGLITAFKKNLDVHNFTASDVFGVEIDQVDDEQRRKAKAINFGLIYGMSEFGLSKQLGISRFDAKQYIDIYFYRYPDVKKYIEETKELARSNGYVESIFGRRLYLPDINSKNFQSRMAAERAAINAPVQGTAADIIKLAMLNIDKELAKSKIRANMTMQVHDELVFEVHKDDVENLKTIVIDKMENTTSLNVSLDVVVSTGNNWNDAH